MRVNDEADLREQLIGDGVDAALARRPVLALKRAAHAVAEDEVVRRQLFIIHAARRNEIVRVVHAGADVAPRPGDKALAEQLRPGGDDDVPQFLFFHGYPSNRFKIAKFSLLAAYSFRNTRKFRS